MPDNRHHADRASDPLAEREVATIIWKRLMNYRIFALILVWMSPVFYENTIHSQDAQDDVPPVIYVTQPSRNKFDFYVINPFTGETIFERTSTNRNCPIKFSPDGEWLHYQQYVKAGDWVHNFARNMRTGEVTELERLYGIYDYEFILWIPETNAVMFSHDRYGRGAVYRYDYTTNSLNTLRAFNGKIIDIAISGGEVFYWYWDDNGVSFENFGGEIYTIDNVIYPDIAVSPDNKYMTMVIKPRRKEAEYFLFIDLVTNEQFAIQDAYIDPYRAFAWSPDSKSLIYLNLDGNFVIYDIVEDQKTLLMSSLGEYMLSFDETQLLWSPHDRYVVVYVNEGNASFDNQLLLFVLDIVTGEEIIIARYNAHLIHPTFLQWVDDKQFVYIKINYNADGTLDESDLFRFNMSTRTEVQLTHTPQLIKRRACGWG